MLKMTGSDADSARVRAEAALAKKAAAEKAKNDLGNKNWERYGRWLAAVIVVMSALATGLQFYDWLYPLEPASGGATPGAGGRSKPYRPPPTPKPVTFRPIYGDRDLENCIQTTLGGCFIVYSSKTGEDLNLELPRLVDAVKGTPYNMSVASLNSAKLVLKSASDSLSQQIKSAVVSARSVSTGAYKGAVLMAVRRVDPMLVDGETGRLVVTVGASESYEVTPSDAKRLLAQTASAVDLLRKNAADASAARAAALEDGSSGDTYDADGNPLSPQVLEERRLAAQEKSRALADAVMDAMLARDDQLAGLSSALLHRSDLSVADPPKAKPTQASKASSGGDNTDERRQRRAAARASRDSSKTSGKGKGGRAGSGAGADYEDDGLTQEQRAELQRRREREARQKMAKEEAESAHFAAAAGDDGYGQDEDQDGQGQGQGEDEDDHGAYQDGLEGYGRYDGEEEPETEDLDDADDGEHGEL